MKWKSTVLVALLAAVLFPGSAAIISPQNWNRNLLVYASLFEHMNFPGNQPVTAKADAIWGNVTFSNTSVYSNMEIILNGNLTIASGGSLTLTNVTLRVNCTANGSNHIEVQSGGALYINDVDGNPDTRGDGTNITALDPSYRYLFWVQSGAVFQMNNSELRNCGFVENIYYLKAGLIVKANNVLIFNNTFSDNCMGLVLYHSNNSIVSGNVASNNDYRGFYLYTSSNNILRGNTAQNYKWMGFHLCEKSNNNTLENNVAVNNITLFYFPGAPYFVGTPSSHGFCISYSSVNNTLRNNRVLGDEAGYLISGGCFDNYLFNNYASNTWYGFDLYRINQINLSDNIATNSYCGFSLTESSNNVLQANTAINCTVGYLIDANSINNDLTGSSVVNYLRIRTMDMFGFSLSNVDVKVLVNGSTVYASPGYGGDNATTDEEGFTGWIPVTFQVFSGETLFDNVVEVWISGLGSRVVDMSNSHVEEFKFITLSGNPVETALIYFILYSTQQSTQSIPVFIPVMGIAAISVVSVFAFYKWKKRVPVTTVKGVPTIKPSPVSKGKPKPEASPIRKEDSKSEIKCPFCGGTISGDEKICPRCGGVLI